MPRVALRASPWRSSRALPLLHKLTLTTNTGQVAEQLSYWSQKAKEASTKKPQKGAPPAKEAAKKAPKKAQGTKRDSRALDAEAGDGGERASAPAKAAYRKRVVPDSSADEDAFV